MKKSLATLSKVECFSLYEAIIKNSNKRWNSAELLAKNDDFGGAIKDLITSIEEMVKAIFMLADSKGFEFRKIEEMDSIIRKSHTIRHLISYMMLALNIFADDLKRVVIKFHEDPNYYFDLVKKKDFMESFMKKYFYKKLLILKDEFYWFSKVESIRQKGSHVDLEDVIVTPLDLSINDYLEVYNRMKNVKYIGQEIINTLNSSESRVKRDLSKLKKKIIINGWYEMIGIAINKTKKGKKNPFNIIEKNIIDSDLTLDDFKNI